MTQGARPAIVVVGAGGIGGTIAGYLARGRHRVTVVDPWSDHVAAINRAGLRVETPGGGFTADLPALLPSEAGSLPDPIDLLVISVKAYDTEAAYGWVADRLATDATVVCAQNGITEDLVGRLAPPGHVIGCAVTLAAEFSRPGVVARTSPEHRPVLTIGELDGRTTPRLAAISSVLEAVGRVTVTGDIAGELWSKLARNAMTNGLAALTGGTTRTLWSGEEYLPIVIRAAAETAAVARAGGVTLRPIAGRVPPDLLLAALGGDETAWDAVAARLRDFALEPNPVRDHLPSMLQDARKGRRTEIDQINGYVAERGRAESVLTPVNERIVELVHALEDGRLAIDPANGERFADVIG